MATKKQDMTAVQKGLALFTLLLRSRRAWSLTELADRLECSKQTILRLVDQLSTSGLALIEEWQGNRKLYRLEAPRRTAPLVFNAEQLTQLTLCRDFLIKFLPENVRREVDEALLTAENYLPASATTPPKALGRALSKGWIDYSPFQDFLKIFTTAIQSKKACLVNYRKRIDQEPKEFLYAPKGLMMHHETMYITGWLVEEGRVLKATRNATLALQRVLAVEQRNRTTINIGESDNLEDGAFGVMLHSPFRATVKFGPDVATYVSERQWSTDQEMDLHANGDLTLTLTSRNKIEFFTWVLGFGPSAQVIAPIQLVEEMAQKTQELAALYQRP